MAKHKLLPLGTLPVGKAFMINPVTNRAGVVTNAYQPANEDGGVEVTMTVPGTTRNETKTLHPHVLVRV